MNKLTKTLSPSSLLKIRSAKVFNWGQPATGNLDCACFSTKFEWSIILKMESVRLFCLLLSYACLISLIIGLFKPWLLLWWEDVQNRKKIILVYGSLAIVFLGVYWALGFFI